MWALTATACVLAGCWLAALGGLILAGALTVSAVARLGHLIRPLNVAPAVVAYPATALAVGALSVCACAVTRSALRQLRQYRTAHAQLRGAPSAGDLSVLDRPEDDAYALPGNPGRIVVTSGMLRTLDGPEREALLAHERARLAGRRHYYFLAAADLASRCHPALSGLRGAIGPAVERVADEAAATAVGDRNLTARAIGRAALAGNAGRAARPSFAAGAAGGLVPQQVKALLQPTPAPHRPAIAAAGLLLACSAVTGAGAAAGLVSLHHNVEIAQGEVRDD